MHDISASVLENAVLGLLTLRPMSGYEIKQLFDKSISFLWRVHMSQIYPALARLKGAGLVEMDLVPQDRKPTKKVYSITRKGRLALQSWLREPVRDSSVRDLFPLKVFFGRNIERDTLLEHIRERLERAQGSLGLYQDMEKLFQELQEGGSDSYPREDMRYWQLALRWAILREQAVRDWCNQVLEEMAL
ncbi:MAG: PadR family transcriptional regulator [Dehalococcoidia bacterium]|nr:PadR family transcriptional regulator [Dehalococcoidia bacterium]